MRPHWGLSADFQASAFNVFPPLCLLFPSFLGVSPFHPLLKKLRVQGSPNTSVPHFGLASFNIWAQFHLGQLSHEPHVLDVPGDLAPKDLGDKLLGHMWAWLPFSKSRCWFLGKPFGSVCRHAFSASGVKSGIYVNPLSVFHMVFWRRRFQRMKVERETWSHLCETWVPALCLLAGCDWKMPSCP